MAPVPLCDPIEGQLETETGKCAKIEFSRRRSRSLRMVVKQSHGTVHKVSLWMWNLEQNHVYLSFCFELNNKKYFAAVNQEESNIQVVPLKEPIKNQIDTKFLFKWNSSNSEEWRSLSSVAEPSKYLSISDNAFTLSTSPETLFKFKNDTKMCNVRTRKLLPRRRRTSRPMCSNLAF